jgi:hypothetical protein
VNWILQGISPLYCRSFIVGMPPIDARLVKAKRFPVHAAVILCNENEMVRLVDPDARFHLGRKMIESESSVLHVACSSRPGPKEVIVRMLKYLVKVSKN